MVLGWLPSGLEELHNCARIMLLDDACWTVWVPRALLHWHHRTLCCKAGEHPAAHSLQLCLSHVSSGAALCEHLRGLHILLS